MGNSWTSVIFYDVFDGSSRVCVYVCACVLVFIVFGSSGLFSGDDKFLWAERPNSVYFVVCVYMCIFVFPSLQKYAVSLANPPPSPHHPNLFKAHVDSLQ